VGMCLGWGRQKMGTEFWWGKVLENVDGPILVTFLNQQHWVQDDKSHDSLPCSFCFLVSVSFS